MIGGLFSAAELRPAGRVTAAGGRRPGANDWRVGASKAVTIEAIEASAMISRRSIRPKIVSAASEAAMALLESCVTSRRRRRSVRSATAPPNTPRENPGTACERPISPRYSGARFGTPSGKASCTTRTPRPKVCIQRPSELTIMPDHSSRKFRDRSAARVERVPRSTGAPSASSIPASAASAVTSKAAAGTSRRSFDITRSIDLPCKDRYKEFLDRLNAGGGQPTTPFVSDLPILLPLGAIVWGLGISTFTTAANTYLANTVPILRRAEAVGYFGVGMTIGQGIGAGFGYTIVTTYGFTAMYVAAAVACVIASALVVLLREVRPPAQQRQRIGFEAGVLPPTIGRCPADRRGAAVATFSAAADVGILTGTSGAGFLVASTSFGGAFTATAVGPALGLVLLLVLLRASAPAPAAASDPGTA